MLHTEYGKGALEAIQYLTDRGLAPERILICHADRQVKDLDIHEKIASTGVFMEYEAIALDEIHDNDTKRRMPKHMEGRGF